MDPLVAAIARIGLEPPGDAPATLELLTTIQRAFVTSVPYETVDIQLGRPPSIDPDESLRRIAARKGGYCFNLNGALRAILDRFGFATTLHVGGVHSGGHPPNVGGDHAVLTVELDGQRFLVDAGLGDGPLTPIALVAGDHRQGPLTFTLRRSTVTDGWQLLHDPKGSFTGCDFTDASTELDAFVAEHVRLSTSPESGFVRTFTIQRRLADRIDILRSRTLSRVDEAGVHVLGVLADADELVEALRTVFDYDVDVLDSDDRAQLWRLAAAQHEAFVARQGLTSRSSEPTG